MLSINSIFQTQENKINDQTCSNAFNCRTYILIFQISHDAEFVTTKFLLTNKAGAFCDSLVKK